jgi:pyruvate carboxylase
MGSNRTIAELLRQYAQKKKEKYIVPTTSDNSLRKWAFENNWNERARSWDAEQERLKIAAKDEEQQKQWEQEVEACRVRTKKAAQSLMELAITVMRDLTQDIKEGRLTTQDRVRLAPVLSKYIEQASSLEGTALGIAQLLEERDNS